jgi:hypothetical protein
MSEMQKRKSEKDSEQRQFYCIICFRGLLSGGVKQILLSKIDMRRSAAYN